MSRTKRTTDTVPVDVDQAQRESRRRNCGGRGPCSYSSVHPVLLGPVNELVFLRPASASRGDLSTLWLRRRRSRHDVAIKKGLELIKKFELS